MRRMKWTSLIDDHRLVTIGHNITDGYTRVNVFVPRFVCEISKMNAGFGPGVPVIPAQDQHMRSQGYRALQPTWTDDAVFQRPFSLI